MPFRFRKSKKVGPFRFTLSKSGLSGSVGGRGLRYQFLGGRKGRKSDKGGDSGGCLGGCLTIIILIVGGVITLNFLLGLADKPTSTSSNSASYYSQAKPSLPARTPIDEKAANDQVPPESSLSPSAEPLPVEENTGPYRKWTSANGKFETEARLLDYSDEIAFLLRRNPRKTLEVPLGKLSNLDKQYIEDDKQNLLTGKVIRVSDGDTITVRDGQNYKVRLVGIDAPEKGQDYSNKASKALFKLVQGKTVRVRWIDSDRYGRLLGNVFIHGQWVNLQLVEEGWAWHFTKYSDDPDLIKAEQLAKEEKKGLWADSNMPTAPWDFRNRPKPRVVKQTVKSAPVFSYWLNTSSNVRHNRSCKYYKNTKRGRSCSSNEGKACGICGG